MKWNRLTVWIAVLAGVLAVAGCSGGKTEDAGKYPSKPITWVVAYPAGGAPDLPARTLQPYVEKYLPNNGKLSIVNKGGSGGTIGMTEVFKAKPDGYTIGTAAAAAITNLPLLGDTPYQYDELEPLLNYVKAAQFLVVPADAPYDNFDEWLAYASEHPEEFTYGVAGNANAQHVAMENFANQADVQIRAITYKGENEILTNLLGKQIKGGILNHALAYEHVKAGTLKLIVNITGVKPDYAADIPTFKELGYDVEANFFNGLFVPLETPEELKTILQDAFKQALEDPELLAKFEELQLIPSYLGPEEFKQEIERDTESNRETLKMMGLIQ
ncbi:tripartite tricarboxylate transporter substrate binding protein [Paenibacillus sp. IB182496]|uniref:Tripartite tricarboxylate transporter substrate binding protein n=1 Tax=Paenibacillus sabuli TaxID=2772509 RepID=A0A927GUT9_9BACL|nr:tripartite tricarboxylate transporter substrate binding protein [Paenibacillus sabuli]MBD2848057.1 tripartite tricarboxylate transporter substrate binding protein [Paenibacillus sabuli]